MMQSSASIGVTSTSSEMFSSPEKRVIFWPALAMSVTVELLMTFTEPSGWTTSRLE